MHFDINKLKGRLDFLEVLLNNTNDKYKRREILNDIKKIKYLIKLTFMKETELITNTEKLLCMHHLVKVSL